MTTSQIAARRYVMTILREMNEADGAGGEVVVFQARSPAEQCRVALRSVNATRLTGDDAVEVLSRRIVTVAGAALPVDFSTLMRVSIGGDEYKILSIERTGRLDRDRLLTVARVA